MIVSVHQPQYLPWLGYFDKIDKADVFVILDNVNYKKNEYQNRNKIKVSHGWQWLTVPVHFQYPMKIMDVKVNNLVAWRPKHIKTLVQYYEIAPHFAEHRKFFEDAFSRTWDRLLDLNLHFLKHMLEAFGIDTKMVLASELKTSEEPTQRIIDICKSVGADTYLAGKGGRRYIQLHRFEEEGIKVIFQEFRHPEYTQQWGEFQLFMSAIDLIFNHGDKSLEILRSASTESSKLTTDKRNVA